MDIYFFADVELQIMIDIRNVNNKILIYNIYNILYILYILHCQLDFAKQGFSACFNTNWQLIYKKLYFL